MKIVIEKTIPFIQGVLEPWGEVVYADGGALTRDDIADADALIVRTRTRCNASLLEGTAVKIIFIASIGTDNVDLEYCKSRGIFVLNASGSNAGGVMNYVCSAIYGTAARRGISLEGMTVGIVGAGMVGQRVETMARSLGFRVLLCDPKRADAEGARQFCDLDTLLRSSDIVTLHLPLTDSTRNLADAEFFSKMKLGAFFINTSRGAIVVEKALLEALGKLGPVIIDTWSNEPDINRELLEKVDVATPHIAGYSYQGKQIATSMAVRSIARYFKIEELYDFFPAYEFPALNCVRLDLRGMSQGQRASAIQYNYPIFTDDFLLRMSPERFEELRHEYHYRREFTID